MEDRYEIRSKIGQGGLGTVYRGYDTRMNREVAIKRIFTAEEDPTQKEESTRQLMKEAGALASLQHPHIVTVFDVGADEDGPYVVMELIAGKTLDELIENAPLTWPDFRELALQTQEALIAAQELNIIHADIKPSNLMLTWLPSGKFQVKVVDFGLATLAHGQSKQELEAMEAVYGSIYFMAPEQFERVPIDARTDLYALACVYYQALTGAYPFDGETAPEVMNAHLLHQVVPIQDVRADIPVWLCDWIMWNLNRLPGDRPESAREALQVFLQNDKVPNPPLSTGHPPASKRPPITSRPLGPRTIQLARLNTAGPAKPASPTTKVQALPAKTKTAPQPLLPPEGSKPSVHTSAHPLPPQSNLQSGVLTPTVPLQAGGAATRGAQPSASQSPAAATRKKGLGTLAKIFIGAVAATLILGIAFLKLSGGKIGSNNLAPLLAQAAIPETTEILVDTATLKLLLDSAAQPTGKDTAAVLKALSLAKTNDAGDADALIREYTFNNPALNAQTREGLIRNAILPRRNPLDVPSLIEFATRINDSRLAAAALDATKVTAGDDHFKKLLEILQTHANEDVRNAAEATLVEIISRNSQTSGLASQLNAAYINASNLNARHAVLRLLAACGNDQTLRQIKEALTGSDREAKLAAAAALGYWPNETQYPSLIKLIETSQDPQIRDRATGAALTLLAASKRARNSSLIEKLWTPLGPLLKTTEQKQKAIALLESQGSNPWAINALESYAKDPANDPATIQLANDALARVKGKK
jgi:serine/threonine protein kinase